MQHCFKNIRALLYFFVWSWIGSFPAFGDPVSNEDSLMLLSSRPHFVLELIKFKDKSISYISASGYIDANAEERVKNFFEKNEIKPGSWVILDSIGGHAKAGYAIGALIRNRKLNTAVGSLSNVDADGSFYVEARDCLSACFDIFIGGVRRRVLSKSRVGVHREGFVDQDLKYSFRADGDMLIDGMIEQLDHLNNMGVSSNILATLWRAKSDEMYYLSEKELAEYGVITSTFTKGSWRLEPLGNYIVAKNKVVDQNIPIEYTIAAIGKRSLHLKVHIDFKDALVGNIRGLCASEVLFEIVDIYTYSAKTSPKNCLRKGQSFIVLDFRIKKLRNFVRSHAISNIVIKFKIGNIPVSLSSFYMPPNEYLGVVDRNRKFMHKSAKID